MTVTATVTGEYSVGLVSKEAKTVLWILWRAKQINKLKLNEYSMYIYYPELAENARTQGGRVLFFKA